MIKRIIICMTAAAVCAAIGACSEKKSGKYAVKVAAAQCINH